MELTQENIEELANKLTIGKLNGNMEKMQDYFKIAEDLIKKYPDLTIEQIAEKYDEHFLEQNEGVNTRD